jgi:hypothetical protein
MNRVGRKSWLTLALLSAYQPKERNEKQTKLWVDPFPFQELSICFSITVAAFLKALGN